MKKSRTKFSYQGDGKRLAAKISAREYAHMLKNNRAKGYGLVTSWTPGEQQALIEKALSEGRVTKCDPADVTNKPVFGFEDSSFEGGKI